jgi:hypothetical protein
MKIGARLNHGSQAGNTKLKIKQKGTTVNS